MDSSSNELAVTLPIVSELRQDLIYMLASNINVSCFVSVKLSGHINYYIWKVQLIYLMATHDLLNLISDDYPFPEDKGHHMIPQYNSLVRGWIFGSMNDILVRKYANIESVRTVWMELQSIFDIPMNQPEGLRNASADLIGFIFRTESQRNTSSIGLKKELYKATVEGCWWKAKSILKVHKNAATEAINTSNGNTILHLAVELGHNYFLEKLLDFLKDEKDTETQNLKGQTALHISAVVGNEYAAKLLVQKRKQLLLIPDHNSLSPLGSAFSNKKLNVSTYLLKSEISSGLRTMDLASVEKGITAAIITKDYDLARTLLEKNPDTARDDDSILFLLTLTFPTDLGFTESCIYPSFHDVGQKVVMRGSSLFHSNFLDKCMDDILQVVKICNNTYCSWLGNNSMILLVPIATLYPIYQLICLLFLLLRLTFSMLYFLLWKVLAVTVGPIKNIEEKKKEYQEAKEILSIICNQMGPSNDGYSQSIVSAVCDGTYEVVDEILFTSPGTINCKSEEGHNIIQLAIIYRSEKVYNLIYHIIERTESYRETKDSSKNNLVHLAGRLAPSDVLDRTTGAALQLQRELIWRAEVEKLILPIQLCETNIYSDTPAMVFTREHQDLMKQGETWLKTTAESCSITAALIVTIVFASAITVPGGSNQESGIPVFQKEIAFTIFALSNAFSLFTAATTLLLFLSILTARFSEKDFLVILPRRLIFGLVMLFLSTTAMIVAFGAILFLVFCDQRPWMLAPICGCACLPISVIVTIKLPLLVDLIQSTYFPIFGKRSYLDACKVNRVNTIFT